MNPIQTPVGPEITFTLPKGEYDNIPDSVSRKVRESVLRHIYAGTQVCLITSTNRSGKSKFATNLSHSFSDDLRTIRLSTQDFSENARLSFDEGPFNAPQSDTLSLIRHCIVDSASLDEKLIIIIDDADYLSPEVFEQLLGESLHNPRVSSKICFIFLGHPNLTGLLENISQTKDASFALLSLDNLSPANLTDYIDYCQSPVTEDQRIDFEDDAIRIILTQSGGSLFKATVILEWSLRFAKENNLSSMGSDELDTVVRHISSLSQTEDVNYFLTYPDVNATFRSDPVNDSDEQSESADHMTENMEAFDMEETVVLPNPRPPLLEKVVALRENELVEPDRELNILRSKSETGNHQLRTLTATNPSPPNKRTAFKYAALGILIGLALLYFNRHDDSIEPEPVIDKTVETASANSASDTVGLSKNTTESQDQSIEKGLSPTSEHNDTPIQTQEPEPVIQTIETALAATEIENSSTTQGQVLSPNNLNDASAKVSVEEPEITDSENADADKNKLTSGVTADAINRLMLIAKHQFAQHKLTTPVQDSAYNTYQIILQLDPGNTKALEGIRQISERYKQWAKKALDRNDVQAAKTYYLRALRINPGDYEIAAILKGLER